MELSKEIEAIFERHKKEVGDILVKHKEELKNNVMLPLFVDALVTGGITFFDEIRTLLEAANIDLKTMDFSRLK